MTYTLNDIKQLALANLSPEECGMLAEQLWDSFPDTGLDDEDPEFMAEIERRIVSVDNGTARAYPYEEVMGRLRARCK